MSKGTNLISEIGKYFKEIQKKYLTYTSFMLWYSVRYVTFRYQQTLISTADKATRLVTF